MSENKKQATSNKKIQDVKEDINILENQAQKLAELIEQTTNFNEWDDVKSRINYSVDKITKESLDRVEEKQKIELKKVQENEDKIERQKKLIEKKVIKNKPQNLVQKEEKENPQSIKDSKSIKELSKIIKLNEEKVVESDLIELDIKDEIIFEEKVVDPISVAKEKVVDRISVAKEKVIDPISVAKEKVIDPISVAKEKVIDPISVAKEKVIDPISVAKEKVIDPISVAKEKVMDKDFVVKNIDNSNIEPKIFIKKDFKKNNFKKNSKTTSKIQKPSFTGYHEKVVRIKRISKTTKGGRSMRFSALVIIGDKKGMVGYGIGKSVEVPVAIRKALKDAKNNMVQVKMNKNGTLFHEIIGRKGAGKVLLKPAPEGTGIIAGGPIRILLEMGGYKDAYSKNLGKNTSLNMVLATINGLLAQKTPKEVANLRDKDIKNL